MAAGSAATPDAVRVVTRQDGISGKSVGTFFLRFVGFNEFTVTAFATVQRFVAQCEGDGVFANGDNNSSAGQNYTDGFCMHGEAGDTFSQ